MDQTTKVLHLVLESDNQREGHPRYRGRRASCPATARARYGGSLTAHPCADSELAGILPGFFLRVLAAPKGDRESKAKAALL